MVKKYIFRMMNANKDDIVESEAAPIVGRDSVDLNNLPNSIYITNDFADSAEQSHSRFIRKGHSPALLKLDISSCVILVSIESAGAATASPAAGLTLSSML
jgi:hypothetical protein